MKGPRSAAKMQTKSEAKSTQKRPLAFLILRSPAPICPSMIGGRFIRRPRSRTSLRTRSGPGRRSFRTARRRPIRKRLRLRRWPARKRLRPPRQRHRLRSRSHRRLAWIRPSRIRSTRIRSPRSRSPRIRTPRKRRRLGARPRRPPRLVRTRPVRTPRTIRPARTIWTRRPDIAYNNRPVDNVAIINHRPAKRTVINVNNRDMRARGAHPAARLPAMIVNAVFAPVAIGCQPHTDGKGSTKNDYRRRTAVARSIGKNYIGIVVRHIDITSLLRDDLDKAIVINLLLTVGKERPVVFGLAAQLLDNPENRRRLLYVGSPNGGRPIRIIRHGVQNVRIVANSLDANIPVLSIDVIFIVRTDVVVIRLLDLIHIGSCRQHLGQQRIGIQCNGAEYIPQLLIAVLGRGTSRQPSKNQQCGKEGR